MFSRQENDKPDYYSDPQNHDKICNSIISTAQFSRFPIIFISPSGGFYNELLKQIMYKRPIQFEGLYVGNDWESARNCLTKLRLEKGPEVPIVVQFIGMIPWSPLNHIILDETHQPIVLMGELDKHSKPLTTIHTHSKIGEMPLVKIANKAVPGITISGLNFGRGPASVYQTGADLGGYAGGSFASGYFGLAKLFVAKNIGYWGVSSGVGAPVAAGFTAATIVNETYEATTRCWATSGKIASKEEKEELKKLPIILPSEVTLSMEELLVFQRNENARR